MGIEIPGYWYVKIMSVLWCAPLNSVLDRDPEAAVVCIDPEVLRKFL